MTIIFADGFESGAFENWINSSQNDPDPVISSNIKHSGNNSMHCYSDISFKYREISQMPVVHLRCFTQMDVLPVPTDDVTNNRICLAGILANWTGTLAFIRYENGNFYWGLQEGSLSILDNYYLESTPSNPKAGVWYCVEVVRDVTNSNIQLYVDGVLKIEVSMTLTNDHNRACVGVLFNYILPDDITCVYVDDVVVADTYIGFDVIDNLTVNNLNMSGNITPTVAGTSTTGFSCGSNTSPWQTVNSYYVNANTINALSGNTINLANTLAFGNNPFTITSTNTITNLNSDLLDNQHGSYYQNASNLNAGTVGTARLGSGTASNSTYLRGDSTWAALPAQQWTAPAVSSVTVPLQVSSNTLSIPQASSSQNGYLSSTDWVTFNYKYGPYDNPNFANVFCTGATSTNYFSTTGNADISGALTVNKIMQSQCNAPTLDNSQLMAHLQVGNGGGRGYDSAPTVTISGGTPETGAEAVADINPTYGTITSIRVITPGSGFKSTPAIYISESPLEKKTASAMAILGSDNLHPPTTIIKQIILTGAGAGQGGGYGYIAVPPSVTIGGAGSGAYATAEIDQTYERVTRINVTSGGSGYSPGTTTVTIAEPNDLSIALSDRRLATAYAVVENGSVVSIFLTGELPQGQSTQRFLDTTGDQYYHQRYSELFLVTNPDEYDAEGVPHNHVPILATNDSFLVKKDFQAGGLIASQQGALFLNYGFKGKPVLSSPPAIYLGSSKIPYPSGTTFPNEHETSQLFNLTAGCTWGGTYYPAAQYMWNGDFWGNVDLSGYYDTLFLFKDDGITPANMVVGALTVWGKLDIADQESPLTAFKLVLKRMSGGSLMRSTSSLDASLDEAEDGPQILIDSPNASIGFSDDCNLYRVVKDEVVALETDNGFIAPAIDANQLVINQDARIVGSLYINELRRLSDGNLITPLTIDAYGYVTLAGINFGAGWGSIYRNTTGSNNIIEIGGTGVIVDGFVNCAAVSSTGDIGTGTVLQINTDTRLYRLAWTPPNMNPTSGIQVQYNNGSNWVNGTLIAAAVATDYITSLSGGSIRLFDALRFHNGSAGVKLYDATNVSGSNGQVLTINSSGYPVWTTPTPSNPFNQNLNTSNDAIFNSVKGTSSAGALKAGNEFTVSWDATWLYLNNMNSRHTYLGTLSGYKVTVQRNLEVGGDLYLSGTMQSGTVPWARISGAPSYGNPFDQNLNTTNDAIFNSVKGTSSSSALKAGNEFSVSWDGSCVNLNVMSAKDMYIGTTAGHKVQIQRDLQVGAGILSNDVVTRDTGGSGNEHGIIGDSGRRYSTCWIRTFHGFLENLGYDEYDDLAIVKQWGEKKPKLPDDYDQSKIKPKSDDPFSMLRATEGDEYFNLGNVVSFALGCSKALAKKQDEHDKVLLQLLDEKEKLSTEVADLRLQLQQLTANRSISA